MMVSSKPFLINATTQGLSLPVGGSAGLMFNTGGLGDVVTGSVAMID
jgi:hypothetical protein